MRRSADRAAISAGPSTEGVGNTIAFHSVCRFGPPGCILPSLRRFPWLFVVFPPDPPRSSVWRLRVFLGVNSKRVLYLAKKLSTAFAAKSTARGSRARYTVDFAPLLIRIQLPKCAWVIRKRIQQRHSNIIKATLTEQTKREKPRGKGGRGRKRGEPGLLVELNLV